MEIVSLELGLNAIFSSPLWSLYISFEKQEKNQNKTNNKRPKKNPKKTQNGNFHHIWMMMPKKKPTGSRFPYHF